MDAKETAMGWTMAMTAMGTLTVVSAGFLLLVLRMDAAVRAELAGEEEVRWVSAL